MAAGPDIFVYLGSLTTNNSNCGSVGANASPGNNGGNATGVVGSDLTPVYNYAGDEPARAGDEASAARAISPGEGRLR